MAHTAAAFVSQSAHNRVGDHIQNPFERKDQRKAFSRHGAEWLLGGESPGSFLDGLIGNIEERTRPFRASGTGGTDAQDEEDELWAEPTGDSLGESGSLLKKGASASPSSKNAKLLSRADSKAVCSEPWIVSPNHPMKVRWDVFVGVLIVYTILVLPWRIGFGQPATSEAMIVFDYCVDACFAIDLFLNFRTGFYKQGTYVSNPCAIAKKYLATLFVPDFLSCIPYELLADAMASNSTADMKSIKLMKFVRLVRLMKLMRLVKIRRLANHMLERLDLNPSIIRLVKLMLKIVIVAHLFACLWYFLCHSMCGQDEQLLPGEPCPEQDEESHQTTNWAVYFQVDELGLVSRYIASFHFVTATMMAVGYGDIYATNTIERLTSILMQLVGAAAFGFILSAVTTLLESANRRETEYKKRMVSVKEWSKGRQLPWHLRKAVREHFAYSLSKKSIFNEIDILGSMPAHLRMTIVEHSYPRWLHQIRACFKHEESAFRADLLLQMHPQQVGMGEIVLDFGEISADIQLVTSGQLEMLCERVDGMPVLHEEWAQQCLWMCASSRQLDNDASSAHELLCGLIGPSELVGQFPASPVRVRGSQQTRSELLSCARETFVQILNQYPGARDRHEAKRETDLEQLLRVLDAPQASQSVCARPCKTLILFEAVACSTSELLQEKSFSAGAVDTCPSEQSGQHDGVQQPQLMQQQSVQQSAVESIPRQEFDEHGPNVDGIASGSNAVADPTNRAPAAPQMRMPSRKLYPLTVPNQVVHESVEDGMSEGGEVRNARSVQLASPSSSPLSSLMRGRKHNEGQSGKVTFIIRLHTLRLDSISGQPTTDDEVEEDLLARWIVPPLHRHKFKWDVAIGLLITYSVIIIPYRIGFGVQASVGEFVIDCLVDILFVFDMILNFRTAFVDADGVTNTIPTEIRKRYLQCWFWVDFMSILPLDNMLEGVGNASGEARAFRLVRILRLVRLLKLVRLLRMGRLVDTMEEYLELSPLYLKLIRLLGRLAMLAHLMGCFWYYSSSHVDVNDDACDSGLLRGCRNASATLWWQQVGIQESEKSDQYIAALYWAFTTMTTVGYGDIHPQNNYERAYAIMSMILGATIFGYIIGSIATLAGQVESLEALSKRQNALVRDFCEEQGLCKSMQKMIRSHFSFYYQHRPPCNERGILALLPGALRKQVVLHINRDVIARLGLFSYLSQLASNSENSGSQCCPLPDWFVVWACQVLEPQAIAAGEDIVRFNHKDSRFGNEIHFVYQGFCEAFKVQSVREDAGGAGLSEIEYYIPRRRSGNKLQVKHSDTGGSCDDEGLVVESRQSSDRSAASARSEEASTVDASPVSNYMRRPFMCFPPGSMFGVEHLLNIDVEHYKVCCSNSAPCFLFVIRQSATSEIVAVCPEMIVALRVAIANALLSQTAQGLTSVRNAEFIR